MGSAVHLIVRRNRLRLGLVGAASASIVAACIFIFYRAPLKMPDSASFIRVFASVGFCFFGVVAIIIVSQLLSQKPALIVNSEGIFHNSNASGPQLVLWNEISGVDTSQMRGNHYLLVYVKEPKKYVSAANTLKTFINRLNFKLHGTPVVVSLSALAGKAPDIMQSVQDIASGQLVANNHEPLNA